jgi:vitamin B12 transporter
MQMIFIRNCVATFLILCAGCLLAAADSADTLDTAFEPAMHAAFDEIVVTATRTNLPVWRSPVPVTVINNEEIERRGGVTLGDILERSEPLTLRRYGSGAALTTMSIRGIAADQTAVLLNGVQLNSPQNGLVDLSTIPLSGIERIEIARGGASSLYGNHAMGGVVNIITRGADEYRPVVDVQAGSGSYGLRRIGVQSRVRSSSWGVAFGLGRDQSDGNFRFDNWLDNGASLRRAHADYVQSYATLDGHARIDDETTLRLFTRYSQADRGLPGAFFGMQAEDRQEDDHLHTALSLSRILSDDVLVEFRPFLIYSEMLYVSNDPNFPFASRSINRQYGASFNINARLRSDLTATVGGELSDAGVDADGLTGGVKRVNTVAYVSGEWRAPDIGGVRSTLFPSLRYDRFSNNHDDGERRHHEEVTWKLGATIQPFAYDRFLLRGSVGRNFKAPGLNDMYWVPGGNEHLVPERSTSADAGMRVAVPGVGGLQLDAGVFRIRAQDRIIWVPDPETGLWGAVNLRDVHSDGFETDLRWRPERLPLRFGVSYTYQDVRQFIVDEATAAETSYQLVYAPYHLLSGEAGYGTSNMHITVYPRYSSSRYTTELNTDRVDGYLILDVQAGYTANLGAFSAIVTLDVRNVLDRDYQVVQFYPMPGRNYEVGVRLRL